MANIKISQLPNINGNLTATALLPIVSTNGTFITDKITLTNLANYILGQSGNLFVSSNISNLSYNVINAAQPNITSVGTLTGLTVVGTSNLGYPNNVVILGGLPGQVLSTDGNGSIGWASLQVGPTGATGFTGSTGATGPQGISNNILYYTMDANNSGPPVASGFITTNNPTNPNLITKLYISNFDNDGDDMQVFLSVLQSTETIILQDAVNSNNLQRFIITAANGNMGNYTELTVQLENASGTGITGFANNLPLLFVLVNGVQGATGATGPQGATGLTGATGPVAGSNTQVLFNDAGAAAGSANLTFDSSNNILSVNGNISASYFLGNGSLLTGIDASQIQNGNSNVKVIANSNVTISVGGNSNIAVFTDTGANINGYLTVSNTFTVPNTAGGATNLAMGDPTQGNLVSNAVTLTNSSSVSNAIAQMNVILGKLVPPSPPNFPANQTITISSLSSYRMANYTQTDNTPGANKSVAGGTTVNSVRRAATYNANSILNAGPGDTGTVTAFLNGANAGSRTLTSSLNGNGTYSNLVIFNNYDYNVANSNITPGFWSVFSTRASGTVTQGWNEVYIAHSTTGNTNTANWFYDSSAPGTPVFSNTSMTAPANANLTFSSTVPHYANTNQFTVTFDVNRLSGNMYPISDTFATGSAGGAFAAPASKTYATANITTPLAQNLYVASGNATVNTTSNIISGFGASTLGPSVTVDNSYNTGTQSLSPGANVLYKTGTTSSATRIEEANVFVGTTIGVGSGLVFRIVNPGSTDTPTYTGSELAFNSETGTLNSYDATVVANILKHDQTNYSTGYSPQGPNLSSGRTGAQYITFKFIRTSVSKFDVKWTGNIAGLWVALPGSIIDSTSGINGWIDMSVAYAGAGVPGSNIGAGGNGSNGCALGGVAPLNTAQTNKAVTATFGTVSSSSTVTNEIYVRIKLTSGQSVTALSLQGATN